MKDIQQTEIKQVKRNSIAKETTKTLGENTLIFHTIDHDRNVSYNNSRIFYTSDHPYGVLLEEEQQKIILLSPTWLYEQNFLPSDRQNDQITFVHHYLSNGEKNMFDADSNHPIFSRIQEEKVVRRFVPFTPSQETLVVGFSDETQLQYNIQRENDMLFFTSSLEDAAIMVSADFLD
jgi:hypothetical protein